MAGSRPAASSYRSGPTPIRPGFIHLALVRAAAIGERSDRWVSRRQAAARLRSLPRPEGALRVRPRPPRRSLQEVRQGRTELRGDGANAKATEEDGYQGGRAGEEDRCLDGEPPRLQAGPRSSHQSRRLPQPRRWARTRDPERRRQAVPPGARSRRRSRSILVVASTARRPARRNASTGHDERVSRRNLSLRIEA